MKDLRVESFDKRRNALVFIAAVSLAVSVAAISAVFVPVGFQGRDDLHYMLAAQQWLNGPVVGANHWANRIPYVLAIAVSYRATGSWETALYLLHSICFVGAAACIWLIGRTCFEQGRVAWFGLAVFFTTPLLFRLPSVFYPEALEIFLAAIAATMVLGRSDVRPESRIPWLFTAGLVGGLVLSIRETALALPIALAAIILLDRSQTPQLRRRYVASLALGYATPVLAELFYYWLMTGDPLHRLSVDSRHIEFVTPERLAGGTPPPSTRVLFNWDLASRWRIPSTVESHWTISPIVRLFTSPGMLLTPWVAIFGGVIAWRSGARSRELVILVVLTVMVQYVLNTFVLSLPPNTRYFGLSLALLCVLAGAALAQIRPLAAALACFGLLFLFPALVVAVGQSRPSLTVDLVEATADRLNTTIYPTGQLAKLEALRLRDRPAIRSKVSIAAPAPGALVAGLSYDRPSDWNRSCPDHRPAFQAIAELRPNMWLWNGLKITGIAGRVPHKFTALLQDEQDAVHLMKRRC